MLPNQNNSKHRINKVMKSLPFKKLDLLTAEPVTLMHEGNSHYTTPVGSILSGIMLILCFILIWTSIPTIPTKLQTNMNISRLMQIDYFIDHESSDHIKLVQEAGFNLAFAVSDAKTGEVIKVDKKFGNIDIYFENTRM